ncbi:MAG: GNAT family N-acetyltransferase [Thermomicrobiales bacterium]
MQTNGETTIRPAIRADYPALAPIAQEILDMHADALPSVFRADGDPLDESYFLDLLASGSRAIYVAEVAGTIVGFATLMAGHTPAYSMLVRRKTATLENLVVTQTHRGTGVGRALFQACVEWAERQGADSLDLLVWEFNDYARRFYERRGMATLNRTMSLPLR